MYFPTRPKAVLFYHFFYPDDVVSARHFADFAEDLVSYGWDVSVLTSDRYCRYPEKKILPNQEEWKGIKIYRVHRPGLNQSHPVLRVVNSFWMMTGWAIQLLSLPKFDVAVVGSDPQFSQFLFPILRCLKRQKKIVYWCYDLYPEAILADGAKGMTQIVAKLLLRFMKFFYRFVDGMVDIGECMRQRLAHYQDRAVRSTLTPWALAEPPAIEVPDPQVRRALFGDAKLTLLYSGSMGKAHEFDPFLKLARRVHREEPGIVLCFACRGNRFEELKKAITEEDRNIRLAPFADESEIAQRLSSADIHLISLRPEWSGIVVPSKFFGSLAVGRPVIYYGPQDSAIARWIGELRVGFLLREDNLEEMAQKLIDLAKNKNRLREMSENAFHAYRTCFSRAKVTKDWDCFLKNLIGLEKQ